ncbi:hypothetical protein K493DRAFT_256087 [Basidiobolus meristosporus CBS 931.73]|uniref:Ion transport domain-containing protein n=1 Tax=Basidiobolus meristosporus CBS 931.73 TaxID=1314790 RepID=A0A1Y1YS17_9FUNG|nr:hypothetical protein K493DRAFT_256087 [Basidiobolus meristosporus CBS 931.73]|eukprot:ORY00838.1 hypothetical protein K493DRAFT_256087 [Basidiobolus meristosporus CBS 931.73]
MPRTGEDTDRFLESQTRGLTRAEQIRNMANQIVYSRFYTFLYIIMAILSLISVVLSIKYECPGKFFVVLEIIINVTMITEVGIRMLSMGRAFWRWWLNIFDIIIVFLCILTLILLSHGCSRNAGREELAGTIFLVIRNSIQFFRLFSALRKNKRHLSARNNTIDFADVRNSLDEGNLDAGHAEHPGFILEDSDEENL